MWTGYGLEKSDYCIPLSSQHMITNDYTNFADHALDICLRTNSSEPGALEGTSIYHPGVRVLPDYRA